MKTTGYSKTPLAKKLGIKDNFNIRIINAPEYYFKLFSDLPFYLKINASRADKKDFIHFFETSAEKLNSTLPKLKKELQPNGIIWISWYKKSAKKATDITEDIIRDIALKNGFGFWIKFATINTFPVRGNQVDSNIIIISNGWNMIGPFHENISLGSLITVPANLFISAVYGYDNGYYTSTTFKVGKGYWEKTCCDGIIIWLIGCRKRKYN